MCVCVCVCVCGDVIMFIADRCVHMALRCLMLLFAPMKTKKLESSSIPYVLNAEEYGCHDS